MRIFGNYSKLAQLQWLIWIMVFLLSFIPTLPMDGWLQSAAFALINIITYAVIIYGNIYFLLPKFYENGKKVLYVFVSALFVILTGIIKSYLILFIYNRFFAVTPEKINSNTIRYFITASAMAYLLSFIFRMALSYFNLKEQTREILAQKAHAELQLLKSQVQPHFLFNTLNNIYYEIYIEAPRSARLIAGLSDIMRYFVDESQKTEVSLETEIAFLENYIALEKIRTRHTVKLNFIKSYAKTSRIPPMLLMTFVENIFKHGIDRTSAENKILISLVQQDGHLVFKTENSCPPKKTGTHESGFGIKNLRDRLTLLFDKDFELNTYSADDHFHAFLKIPAQ